MASTYVNWSGIYD